ncbi:MAG: glycosyltransferase [Candidatus Doudnabacteria bacterium]|nr:glycosyltransferase [bacterium]MDZ4243804.1 glycosyltransferase [Candidatus Doudnabacteria bacterium]
MKIIYIANIRLPTEKAHGIQIMKMCEAFALAGTDLELVIPTRTNSDFSEVDPFVYYGVKRIFKITPLKTFDPTFLQAFPAGSYGKGQIFFFTIALFRYLKSIQTEDVLFYTRDEHLLPVLFKFSKRIIWEGHALSERPKKFIKYFKACQKIVVLTKSLKKILVNLGIQEKNILVAPDAVDLGTFDFDLTIPEARIRLNLPQGKIILGYTGTFRTKNISKGLETVLEALQMTADPKIIFVAVGGAAADIKHYQNLARNMNVEKRVMLLPKVDQPKVAICQKAFDVLLMPFPKNEHYAYFMSPLKMFEYMASGRPIVTADLPSIREILGEESAVFAEAENSKSFADGIKKILSDSDLADKISLNARQKVQEFTWQKRARNILNFSV